MKKNHILLLVIISLLGTIVPTNAQTLHTWDNFCSAYRETGTDDIRVNNGGTHYVFIDNDVSLSGTITIDNATTIRFLGRGQYTNQDYVTIRNGYSGTTRGKSMFRVIGGSKLSFNNDDRDPATNANLKRIIIDGGANFSAMDKTSDPNGVWRLTAGQGAKRFSTPMIESIGALEMYKVTVRNYYVPQDNSTTECGVISLAAARLLNSSELTGKTNLTYRYTTLKDCVIEKCKGVVGVFIMVGNCDILNKSLSPENADRYITLENVIVRNCVTFCDRNGWGGLIRCRGGSLYSMKMNNCLFENNFSHNDGAVLWWNAGGHKDTKCTIDGCEFKNNRAMRDAGGLRLEGSFSFVGGKTIVSGNECLGKKRVDYTNTYVDDPEHPGNGAGIQIFGYAGTYEAVGGTLTYNLPNCLEVTNNHARNSGGGISFNVTQEASLAPNTTINADFNGAVVKNNTADISGGGIYFSNTSDPERGYKLNILLNSGEISGNQSINGGGLYVKDININSNADKTVYIKNNKAVGGNGGGIYLENANISLNSVIISENTSYSLGRVLNRYGGGGIFVNGGSFSMNAGSITRNETDMYGGGVFVQNESSQVKNIELAGGEVIGNSAKYGGGIATCGYLQLAINDVKIESNEALNGGGLFTQGSSSNQRVTLQYSKGIIRNNNAKISGSPSFSTAYNKLHSDVAGIGGGIYLDQYSRMTFPNPNEFGIYNNRADVGADDIFGSNNYVEINLPNISELNLTEYTAAKIHELYWGEDYITNDTHYGYGLKLKGNLWDSDRTNQRYRDVFERKVEGNYYVIDFGNRDYIQYTDKYLSLTVGWYVSALKIYKEGMKAGENAIFKIYKVDGSSLTEYMTVVLTDADKVDDNVRLKQVVLKNDGTYRIVETGWSWAYDANVNSIQRTLNSSSKPEDYEFRFKNTEKNNSSRRDEDIKINKMKF